MLHIENIDLNDPRVLVAVAQPVGWAGDIKIRDLYYALEQQGIPKDVWPSVPTDTRCLERALTSLKGARNLVRPLPKAQGWSLVVENPEKLELKTSNDPGVAHKIELTCKVKRRESDGHLSSLEIVPSNHPAVPMIKEEFRRYRGDEPEDGLFTASTDLSQWFSRVIVPWCRGVATRSRGGSYYILKGEYLDRTKRVAAALEQASVISTKTVLVAGKQISIPTVVRGGKIWIKPEVSSTAAIEILVDNIIRECDNICDRLHEKLTSEDLGIRALETQRDVANDCVRKLNEYEQLLGMNLQDVKDRLNEITAGIGIAEIKLLGETNEFAQYVA